MSTIINEKKKNIYVPFFTDTGEARTSTILLPGRHPCKCLASKHDLVRNCTNCGRIVCKQEGSGPCFTCGNLVCTREERAIVDRNDKEGRAFHAKLMNCAVSDDDPGSATEAPSSKGGKKTKKNRAQSTLSADSSVSQTDIINQAVLDGLKKATVHRDKLLDFDKSSQARTRVIDDQCDFYSDEFNNWLSDTERLALGNKRALIESKMKTSRLDRKMTFDFAGREVVVEDFNDATQLIDEFAELEADILKGGVNVDNGQVNDEANLRQDNFPHPVWMEPEGNRSRKTSASGTAQVQHSGAWSRLQDSDLQEMVDSGMCLSIHQPFATMLVRGFKQHEGRSWYTTHRGRLWIASTTYQFDREAFHTIVKDENANINDFPLGCLLGCVNVVDCLSLEEYREKFPDGDMNEPYIFICEYPQEITAKFPCVGNRKIYKLDPRIHEAAVKSFKKAGLQWS